MSEDNLIGYEPPWKKTKGKVLFRPKELSVWIGINGHGKSQFLGQILLGMMNQGAKVCIASLKLLGNKLILRLIKQSSGVAKPEETCIESFFSWSEDKLWLIGAKKANTLIEKFLQLKQRYGIDVFVIDTFTSLDISGHEKTEIAFIKQLCEFKNRHHCHIHIIVHPRKMADESIVPRSEDYKGAKAVPELADNLFCIWRNKEREQLVYKKKEGFILTASEEANLLLPDCLWRCDKQGDGNWKGTFGFWFDKDSGQYLEQYREKKL